MFGRSFMAVQSNSMEGEAPENFSKGDVIVITRINTNDAKYLQVGQIITFKDLIDGDEVYNTHRIVAINDTSGVITYTTKGDNNPENDKTRRLPADIVGVYDGEKISGAGNVLDFIQSKWGFFFCLVAPLLLFFLWRLFKLIVAIKEYNSLDKDAVVKTAPSTVLKDKESDE